MSIPGALQVIEELFNAQKLTSESLESLISELLNFRHLEMPTFSEELRLQTSLDEVFLQIDTERVHESLVKGHRMRRLKELPARQLACISLMLENTNYRMAEDERLLMMTGLRQAVLRRRKIYLEPCIVETVDVHAPW